MKNSIELIPAIMPKDLEEVASKVAPLRNLVNVVQLDIMDGIYVPEKTWPFFNIAELKNKEDIEMPLWEDLDYELDLMVSEPEKHLDLWLKLSPARIIFHYASVRDFEKLKSFVAQVKDFIEIGIAITGRDNMDKVLELVGGGFVYFVQCMGIKKIGYQGEEFDEQTLKTIARIRRKFPETHISVDGGVSYENIPDIIESGADRIVSGSAVFANNETKANILKLKGLF